MTAAARRALFLDRDSTLNPDPTGYIWKVEDCQLFPGVGGALRRMQALGFELVVVTNQAGIGHGYYTVAEMHAFNQRLSELLAAEGVTLRHYYFCPTHPEAKLPAYRVDSPMRKPGDGMIRQTARELNLDLTRSFGVGDRETDVRAFQAAGVTAILVLTGEVTAAPTWPDPQPALVAADLASAADFIARQA